MSIIPTSSSALAEAGVDGPLKRAIEDFQDILNDQERHEMRRIRAVPDAGTMMVFTAELDLASRSRKGSSVSSKLHRVLLSVRNFCSLISGPRPGGVIDTFVSSHPEIAALVWGSVKLTMLIILNYTSYYGAVADLFMRLGKLCPVFAEYQILFPSSTRLQLSLSEFHAAIVRCCKHVVEVVRRPWHGQFLTLLKSFEQEFSNDADDIHQCSADVKREIYLAKAQADKQDQELQVRERAMAATDRKAMKRFFARHDDNLNRTHELILQREKRETRKRKRRLLDKLSTYDYTRSLKQSQRKRYGDTASWVFQTPEFRRWVDESGSPLLWCSGKIGSGKTITTASVVDEVLREAGSSYLVSFFFIQPDDQVSLQADTILRSILRQRLPQDPNALSDEEQKKLQKLDDLSDLDRIVEYLRDVPPVPKTSYVIIDGLDECDKPERDKLLRALSSLIAVPTTNMKLFLAGRDSLSGEIQKTLRSMEHISMDSAGARTDIATYVNGVIEEETESGALRVGDPSLIEEIKGALIQRADGMFLWVFFQVREICSQHCDADIRTSIANLPKDLTETFCRALRRILDRRQGNVARKVFPWITAAKRPLSLNELREAIAVEIGQQYSRPDRLYNDIQNIGSWCESLVQFDEEQELVQFVHHSVRQFLLKKPANHDLAEFHLDIDDVDHHVGEVCTTYLDFNDFKTTVDRRNTPIPLSFHPKDIPQTVLGPRSPMTRLFRKKLKSKGTPTPIDIQSITSSQMNGLGETHEVLHLGHPFLKYASTYWIFHTTNFQDGKSKTWNLWKHMVIHGHDLAIRPWTQESFNVNNPALLEWAHHAHHYALMRVIASSETVAPSTRRKLIRNLAKDNDPTLLNIFLETYPFEKRRDEVLRAVSRSDDLASIESLLTPELDVNNMRYFCTLPSDGRMAIIEKLLTIGADVNTVDNHGQTALRLAASDGELAIIERLLAAGADVNTVDNVGCTALHLAATYHHRRIAEKLLTAGADVNAVNNSGWTALQKATARGHLKIVERLLTAGADVNIVNNRGQTALQLAVTCYRSLAEKLHTAGADENADHYPSRSAELLTRYRGIVDILEKAGAGTY
ncbi:hypothetical protein F4779DRAFT_557782 [Xylariaceae sp. FL0662B]|nr:hypothetical protein F4779DRAFT_557782 [Xylariaceae sp. FL0662B]